MRMGSDGGFSADSRIELEPERTVVRRRAEGHVGDLQQDKSDWEDDEKNRSIKAEDSGIFRRNAPVFLSD